MPIKFRLVFTQATPVLPLPIVKSRTVSPSFVYVRIRYSSKATGFCVGCKAPFLTLSNSINSSRHIHIKNSFCAKLFKLFIFALSKHQSKLARLVKVAAWNRRVFSDYQNLTKNKVVFFAQIPYFFEVSIVRHYKCI